MSTAGKYSPASIESQVIEITNDVSTHLLDVLGEDIDPNAEISICEKTEIKIIVQPVEKFRFRYRSEMMGTHGSLLGERDESIHRKEVPTVQLINCPFKNAVIRCTIVTSDEDRRIFHAHHLVKKYGNKDEDDPHDIEVSDENDYIAMFCNMGIIHTAKKNMKDEIMRKKKIELLEEKKRNNLSSNITTREELDIRLEAEDAQKWMNLNSVSLCFQGFCYGENNVLYPLTDKIYSRPINNLKSALTGELKICRIDRHWGSADGNDEIWLLVEKVGKKNIRVKLFEVDDNDVVLWEADGKFSELDVHHQYAIVFRTPPYKDTNITEQKEVFLRLDRPSDGELSNTIKFFYKPTERALSKKRTLENQSNVKPSSILDSLVEIDPQKENDDADEDDIYGFRASELKKLINECDDDDDKNMKELKEIVKDKDKYSMLKEYCSLFKEDLESEEQFADSGDKELQKCEFFAEETLKQIMDVVQETEKNNSNSSDALSKIKSLLEEAIYYGDTPLHFCIRYERIENAKNIIMVLASDPELKEIVDLKNSCGKTPLHLAAAQDQPEIVCALLELGADPNITDDEYATPLCNAITAGALRCVNELFIKKDMLNIENHTSSGWAPIHLAVKAGSIDILTILIKAEADINLTDVSYGRTVLHLAVQYYHRHVVEYLLEKTKINVNAKNFGGKTALDIAEVKKGKIIQEIIELLKKHGADANIVSESIDNEEREVVNDEDDEHEDDDDEQLSLDHNLILPPLQPIMMPPSKSAELSIASEFRNNVEMIPVIKTESNSDTEENMINHHQNSFNLSNTHQMITPMEEELILKDEPEDDYEQGIGTNIYNSYTLPKKGMSKKLDNVSQNKSGLKKRRRSPNKNSKATMNNSSSIQMQLDLMRLNEEKLTDNHVNRIKNILDRTGGWEKLANHTNHGSLIRLYRKISSPSTSLFIKIRLQMPDVTVRQVKKWLIDVEEFEAASALEG